MPAWRSDKARRLPAALPARIVKSIEMLGMGRLLKSYATVAEALQAARP